MFVAALRRETWTLSMWRPIRIGLRTTNMSDVIIAVLSIGARPSAGKRKGGRRPSSHVPYKSQIEVRAAYMPDAGWVSQDLPKASLGRWVGAGFDIVHSGSRSVGITAVSSSAKAGDPVTPDADAYWVPRIRGE
jgi:hypothetical protein